MASLRKRNDKWQAQVRRIGHTLRTKTFINRADALRWIRQTEQELDRTGLAYDPSSLERITVADLLRRYVRDVTPGKRGHASEAERIEVFLRHGWANLTLARITPQAFTQHRDKRLHEVEAGTVIRELGLLRTVFEIARRDGRTYAGQPACQRTQAQGRQRTQQTASCRRATSFSQPVRMGERVG